MTVPCGVGRAFIPCISFNFVYIQKIFLKSTDTFRKHVDG